MANERKDQKIIVLEQDNVDLVFERDKLQYKAKTLAGKDNPLAGKDYWLYTYEGTNFTDRNPNFSSDLRNGNIAKIVLLSFTEVMPDGSSMPRVSLSSYTTLDSVLKRSTVSVELARISRKKRVLEESPVTDTELASFHFAE